MQPVNGVVSAKDEVFAKLRFSEESRQEQRKILVTCLADVETEEVEWLWYPYIPKRKITLMTGQEGIGKSWLTCAIAAAITNGKGLPETASLEQGNVLMLSAEDGLADTLKPRLVSAAADCRRVFAPLEKLTFDEKGLVWFSEMIAEYNPLLVIVDPLFAYTGAKIDINKANEARSITSQLANIAEKLNTSLLLIRHFNKAKGHGDSRQAGMSSIDWRAAARVELLVGVDPDDPSKRAIIHDKHNLSEKGNALGFTIRDGQFLWTGESHLTVARMLSSAGDEEETQGRNDAADFLRQLLKDGPIEADDVEKARRKAGVSDYSLRQAKRTLRIKPHKTGFGKASKWQWELPNESDDNEQSDDTKGVEFDAKAAKALKENENQRLSVNGDNKSNYGNDLSKGVENLNSQRLSSENQRLSSEKSAPLDGEEGEIE
jgi:hypothetical protein